MSDAIQAAMNAVEQDLTGEGSVHADVQAQIQNLLDIVKAQQEQLNSFQSGANARREHSSGGRQSVKPPPIPAYCGNKDERSSVKVKGFIYNVRKVGALSNMNESQMLALAECHLQSNAAGWMMRMEKANTKPGTLDELQDMLIKEFVPSDERSRARMKLLTLQMKRSTEAHITLFQELVEMCSMPLSEMYLFFFMSLTGKFNEEFTKNFPTGEPQDIQLVYDFARTIDRSLQWGKSSEKGSSPHVSGSSGSALAQMPYSVKSQNRGNGLNKAPLASKDGNLLSWGPANQGEKNMYRQNDRCFKCGVKGFKSDTCNCKKTAQGTGGSEDPNA